jgi:hypothetical protein
MSREAIYDAQISPLMAQIIAICKEHKIPMLADFDLNSEETPELKCTSCLLDSGWEPAEAMMQAYAVLRPTTRLPFMLTVDHGDGRKEITAIL